MERTPSWLKLDNAGKIFPATSSRRSTGVFRISCELHEPVREAPLQRALDRTLQQFPHFLYILRSGLFWYYLEASDIAPTVHEENRGVCAQLFYRNKRGLLFDVSYYHNRINLDVYHALTDGTGAMQFFKAFLCRYLTEVHPEAVHPELADEIAPAPLSSRAEDSFQKYYKHMKPEKSNLPKHVYRLSGIRSEEQIITEGRMPCKDVLVLAKAHGASLTIFLSALLVMSIHREMMLYKEKKPVVLTVPVNLRNYFPSETARNFFGNIRVAYRFGTGKDDLGHIISALKAGFEHELTKERLSGRISRYMSVERNPFAKIAPLSFKNFCLRIARRISDLGETMVISNVGRVELPKEIAGYVRNMTVLAGTAKLQACVCTCGDVLSVGFSSQFEETDIQRNFFRMLAEMGVRIEVASNSAD